MLRLPAFGTATAASVLFGTAFGAMLLLVTLWCQDVWGWSALRAGLAVAPGPLMVPFLSVGVTYLPIPIGGALLLCFVLERITLGPPPLPEGEAAAVH